MAGQPLLDDQSTQGAVLTLERVDAAAAGETLASAGSRTSGTPPSPRWRSCSSTCPTRCSAATRATSSCWAPRAPTTPPRPTLLRQEIARLEPTRVYLPMGIGGHVDHQLARDAGLALLADARRWMMPCPDYANRVVLYEDFPYAWWEDFGSLGDMPEGSLAALPADMSLTAEFADISDQIERKIRGIALYESQIERLFDTQKAMASAVRAYAARTGDIGRVPGGLAERYWVTTPA